jgi:hypothetical protein
MAVFWSLIVFPVAVVFAFQHGLLFALGFLGTSWIPCIAVAGAKWGVIRGDRQQRIGVPVVAALLLAFAYWLSTGVEVLVFGHIISGLTLFLISAVLGLTVPLAMGGAAVRRSN